MPRTTNSNGHRTVEHYSERGRLEAGFGAIRMASGPLLPLTDLEVRSTLVGLDARTTLRQRFENPLDEFVEATYIFPLPDRAAVTAFELRVGDRVVTGELKERGEARKEYAEALETGHRAALAEEERPGVFTMQVGNLPPGEAVLVELSMVGPMEVVEGEATFRFPLVVAQRYISGLAITGPSVGMGTMVDTRDVPDASRISPPVLLPGFPNPVRLSIEVELDEMVEASRCRSSLHHTVIEGHAIRILPGERLDRDFILRMPVAMEVPRPVLRVDEETHTFSLTIFPPKIPVPERPRCVVFLLDRSGSMGGWSMVAARRAVGRMIDSLQDGDEFNVLAFDNSVEYFEPRPVLADNQGRWDALEWLSKIEARGGTEMQRSLRIALGQLKRSILDPVLVLITDGQVGAEDHCLQMAAKHRGKAIIHTVGIDKAVNAGFLRRLAKEGTGTCELVESERRLDEALGRVMRQIGTPVLSGIEIKGRHLESLTPAVIPDVYPDRPVVMYGRGNPAQVRVQAKSGESPWSAMSQAETARAGVLHPAWGRSRVRDLEDRYAIQGSRKLEKEIVETSLQAGVLCRFTAFLAVDEAEVVNPGGVMEELVQAVELSAGAASVVPKMVKLKRARVESGSNPKTVKLQKAPGAKIKGRKAKWSIFSRSKAKSEPTPVGPDPLDPVFYSKSVPDMDSLHEDHYLAGGFFEELTMSTTDVLFEFESGKDECDAPVLKYLSLVITKAVREGASEILWFFRKAETEIFYLIGNDRQPIAPPPARLADEILSQIKARSGIMGEQTSGSFEVDVNGRRVEVQVSVYDLPDGEHVVMRLVEG